MTHDPTRGPAPGAFPIPWDTLLSTLREGLGGAVPSVTALARERPDPFAVLVSTVISLRTRDAVTEVASARLLAVAPDPRRLLDLSEEEIQGLIYPACFYRNKARSLRAIAARLLEGHGGAVPSDEASLLALPGVGRKVAALVRSEGFGLDAVCVDTHVHRISNRAGWVVTRHPDETQAALQRILPVAHWSEINTLLVSWGQRVCTPLSPFCSRCGLAPSCPRVGVGRSR